ncbi:monovalent cation/H(+) antiporter subunit G [Thalassiella azotivora]
MDTVLDVVGAALLLLGVGLTLLAGVGVLRFPDVLTRMHAQTKPAVLGLLLVLAGVAATTRHPGLTATLVLVAAFQVLTAPVGAHMIGRAAHRAGESDDSVLARDDLAASGRLGAGRRDAEDDDQP